VPSRFIFTANILQDCPGSTTALNLLNAAGDITQATRSARVFDITCAKSALHFSLDVVRNVSLAPQSKITADVVHCVIEAVADWDRILVLLDSNPDFHIGFLKYPLLGKIDNIAIRLPAEPVALL
jgi:hypothetical protein